MMIGINFSDDNDITVGASILPTADDIFAKAGMIVKVKKPLNVKRKKLLKGQILSTYLHLAPNFPQTDD
ncbi:alanine dehydrogenase [Vibrio sp. MEBiC08052]|nr:alanine dehydrogenase [Vibrio sp. MEBiC08052]